MYVSNLCATVCVRDDWELGRKRGERERERYIYIELSAQHFRFLGSISRKTERVIEREGGREGGGSRFHLLERYYVIKSMFL